MVTSSHLLRLSGEGIDLHSGPVEGAPTHSIGSIVALATDPTATKLFKIAKLITASRGRVYRCRIGGIMAGCCEAGVPVEVSGDAVVVGYGGVLAWVPLGVTDTHFGF